MAELTDVEVLAGFMEPRPTDRTKASDPDAAEWWMLDKYGSHWEPREITLNECREIEERLTDEQWLHYCVCCWKWYTEAATANDYEISHISRWRRALIHLSADQKIKALAAVIRTVQRG